MADTTKTLLTYLMNNRIIDENTAKKIQEEIQELEDAASQNAKVLIICELCDLIGAIEAYAGKQFNLTLDDLIKMKDMTKESFLEGKRK